MRTLLAPVWLCAALLTACAAGGSSTSTLPGGVPTGAAVPPPQGGVRRTESVPSCSGTGTGSVAGGFSNTADGKYSAVLGGSSNEVCDGSSSIGGGFLNAISSGADTAFDSSIGGGYFNSITGNGAYSVIAGGSANAISGNGYATIGGGASNAVSGEWGTVAGGNTNTASGNGSNVAGGANNTASGQHATVVGGSKNTASGNQSLAAGVNSNAATAGSFVWSDDSASATQLSSTEVDQFLARASGGFTFWTNATNTVGVTLAPGSGAWASASDRAMKTNVARVDDAEVLDKVASLPISTWSYVSERGVRHVGPMAQDFYAAFGVGEDNKHITSIDEDGVALAAIKALRAQLRAQQHEIDQLRADERTARRLQH